MKGYRSMLPGLALGLLATTAWADLVGGEVDPVNTLTPVTYVTNLGLVPAGLTDVVIVSGTINNNSESGWMLTVTSANGGKLQRLTGGAGRELVYNNITFVGTSSGTLGAGLTDPSGSVRNVGSVSGPGTAHFYTHSQEIGTGTATSATVNYTFELQITVPAYTSLLSGTYTDNITLSLNNDS